MLDISFDNNGQEQVIHPVLLQHESELVMVDCGYPGFLPLLEEAANQHGLSLQNLTGIIITHHDIDHLGALFELKQMYPQVKGYTSQEDAPYVEGREKSLRLQQAEAIFPSLPEDRREWALQFQELLKGIRSVKVDQTLKDSKELTFLPSMTALLTPGHMPGHLSLYLQHEKTLIAADAVVAENGVLNLAKPMFTMDMPQAVETVRKLAQLEIETIVCFHGRVINKKVQQGLTAIVERYPSTLQNKPA